MHLGDTFFWVPCPSRFPLPRIPGKRVGVLRAHLYLGSQSRIICLVETGRLGRLLKKKPQTAQHGPRSYVGLFWGRRGLGRRGVLGCPRTYACGEQPLRLACAEGPRMPKARTAKPRRRAARAVPWPRSNEVVESGLLMLIPTAFVLPRELQPAAARGCWSRR